MEEYFAEAKISCVYREFPYNRAVLFRSNEKFGEVAEWSNAAVLKTAVRATVPRVRIPPSPPEFKCLRVFQWQTLTGKY